MSSIDKRVVEMGFENKGFEQGIKTSQESLKSFDQTLSQTAKSSSLTGLGNVVTGIGGKFSALGTIATGALLKMGSQALVMAQQFVKSLDQISAGFGEYELKINSIKVMLAGGRTAEGLPVTLDMVNSELEKLNEYSDQTIYSFSDMTANIGKFTNAGVDLFTAVQAIKGIANAAALSGANSGEAARAMYNFAQALSAGYIKLIDWKSIENANMATVEFKTQLMEAAVAAGTLEKTADGMYKVLTGGGMEELISPTKMFNQSLENQWLTSEVLTTTLGKYADATTEIGAKATEAATKVRTFSQLMETTKEAIGSGWAMTFEHIFGNFDEATKFYTAISNVIGGIIQKNNDARNGLLKSWKDFGGRNVLLRGFSTAWHSIYSIIKAVGEAFKYVIPPVTVANLAKISWGFKSLMESLAPTARTLLYIKTYAKGLFSVVSLALRFLGSIFKGLFDGLGRVLSLVKGEGLLQFFAKISMFFINLNNSAKKGETFIKISKAISNAIGWIGDKISAFFKIVKEFAIFSGIVKLFNLFKDATIELFNAFRNSKLVEGFIKRVQSLFASLTGMKTEQLSKSTSKISKSFESLKDKLKPVGDFLLKLFDKIKTALGENWKVNGFENVIEIIKLFLTGGLFSAIAKFFKSLTGITSGVAAIPGSIRGVLTSLQVTLKSYQEQLKAKNLIMIAAAIALLVLSLALLTRLDQDKLLAGVGVITALFANLSVSMLLLDKFGSGKSSAKMIALAVSVLILSSALKSMKDVKPESIYAVTVMIGELVASSILLGKFGKKAELGTTNLLALALAVVTLAISVKMLGDMDLEVLKQGTIALSILMIEITALSMLMTKTGGSAKDMLAASIAMNLIASAVSGLAAVVILLGQFKPEKIATGIGGLAGIMIVLALGMQAVANPKVLIGATAMIIMAAAITLFVPAIAMLGVLPIKTILTGLGAIAGIFTVLGIAGLVLAPLVVPILAISGAVALLGVAMLAAGTGVMLFGTGLALLAGVGVAAIGVLILSLTALVSMIPFILSKVAEGLVSFVGTLASSAPALMVSLATIIDSFLVMLGEQIPLFVGVVFQLISDLLAMLVLRVPEFVNAGMLILIGFLEGIANNIGQVVGLVYQIVTNFLNGIADNIPNLIASGANIIIAFITGIGTQTVAIADAAFNVVIDFINGLANSIEENTPLLLAAIANLCTAFSDGIKEYFNIEEGTSIASNLISGLVNGISTGIAVVMKAVKELGAKVIAAIKALLGIDSPSTVMEGIGEYTDEGLANGIKNRAKNVIAAAKNLVKGTTNAFSSISQTIADAVNSEINTSPVITPVLDLNQITSGANSLSKILSSGQTVGLAKAKSAHDLSSQVANQNGSNSSQQSSQSVVNQFNMAGAIIRSDEDIEKLADKILKKQENIMRSRGLRPGLTY